MDIFTQGLPAALIFLLAWTSVAQAGPRTLLEAVAPGWAPHAADEGDEAMRIDPDRPHLPEASTTVGQGRVVLESGYTFTERGAARSHSYPEAVLRVGAFADWFEARVGQNLVTQDRTVSDTYVGVKLALVEQLGVLPQIAVITQMTIASEARSAVPERVLPGVNLDCAWGIVKDLLNVELLVAANRVRDDASAHVEIATGLTAAVTVARGLEAFVEWDAFYPLHGADIGVRHVAVAGLVYFVTRDLAVDLRAGLGLNRQAIDVLAGAGFSIRY